MPVVIIEHIAARRIEIQRVYGKVAPRRILILLPENIVADHSSVLILLNAFAGQTRGMWTLQSFPLL